MSLLTLSELEPVTTITLFRALPESIKTFTAFHQFSRDVASSSIIRRFCLFSRKYRRESLS